MIAALWARFQGWVAAAGLVLGAVVSAWVMGRRSGVDRARARAAEAEQRARKLADEVARAAERDGADKRLRDGNF